MLSIACISQKGGVGKSTLARLVARTYASGGWRVKIADLNTKQKTSVDWAATRMNAGIEPHIDAAPYATVRQAAFDAQGFDLVVFDGKPDSDATTLDIAKAASLLVVPTGVTQDDLYPQIRFANELKTRGIPVAKMLFVINKTTGSQTLNENTIGAIEALGYPVVRTCLRMMTTYVEAQNTGRAISEVSHPNLREEAEEVAQAIVARFTALTPESAR